MFGRRTCNYRISSTSVSVCAYNPGFMFPPTHHHPPTIPPMSPRTASAQRSTTASSPYPRRNAGQPKSSRQQFSACGACRMRRCVHPSIAPDLRRDTCSQSPLRSQGPPPRRHHRRSPTAILLELQRTQHQMRVCPVSFARRSYLTRAFLGTSSPK